MEKYPTEERCKQELHKIRDVMGLRDNEYSLEGAVELDEGFFSTGSSKEDTDEPLKRGRGSQRKTKVLVMSEFCNSLY